MAWNIEKFTPKYVQVKPTEEKKQVSSFYDDFQTRRAENSKSIGEKNPVTKAVSKSKTSNSKKSATTSQTEPKSDLKFYGGYQSYADRKKNGRVFTPSTVLGRKMSERPSEPNTVLGRYANSFTAEGTLNAKRRRYSKVDPATGKQIVISDYEPGSHSMTKSEYNRRRAVNPSMPEYGSYEYFADAERALRPMMEEIANDDIRNTDYVRQAYAYAENKDMLKDDPANSYLVDIFEKILYQDRVITEYANIHEQLSKFERNGVHFDESGEVDVSSGKHEAEFAKRRYENILSASALSASEHAQSGARDLGVDIDVPEYTYTNYKQNKKNAGLRGIENANAESYDYFGKYKDIIYNDDLIGRALANGKLGRIGIEASDAGFASFEAGVGDTEAYDVYNLLSEKIQENNKAVFINDTKSEEAVAFLGQNAPQMVDQTLYGAGGQIIGGTLGALTGVPGASSVGRRVGGATAVASYAYRQTAGDTFMRLIKEYGLPVEDAKKLAQNEAAVAGAIEFGLELATQGVWSGTNKVAMKTAGNTVGGFATKKLTDILTSAGISPEGISLILKSAKTAGELATESAGEYIEEALQTGTSINTDKYAQNGEVPSAWQLGFDTIKLWDYSDEEKKQMHDSGKAGAFMNLGRSGTRMFGSMVANKTAEGIDYVNDTVETGRTINEQGQAQDVVDAGLGYDNATQANQYAQKMQTKQEGGGTLSNWNVGRQFQKNVQAFQAEKNLVNSVKEGLGVDVELYSELANEDGKTLNGRYDGNNRIDISKNGTTSVPATLGHEVLHFMQNNAPQAYQAMHKYVSDMINSGESNGFKERFNYHKNVNGYNDYVATEEIVAELAESLFGKKSSIDSMVKNNPKMVQSVLDGIKSTKAKIKDRFLAPNTNRTGLKQTYAQLDKFEQMYNNALREAVGNKGNIVVGEPRIAGRSSYAGIESRLEGDNLLDAYDTIETIKNVGGTVDENGYVKVFHNTSRDSANNIRNTGKMSAKEDGVFFSTKADGQASGYGDETIELNIPVEMLVLDDIFDDEAHFRIPLKSKNDTLDVSKYLVNPSGRNSYAGEHAKTANFEELQKAMAMDEKGIDAEIIWQETGWGKGQDGLWRFEIDDSEAEYIGPGAEVEKSTHKLSEVLKHDKLYEAYPELKDLFVIHTDDMGGGQYSPGLRWIFIDSQMTNEEKRKTLLHEVQHAIQEIENFAVGASYEGNEENYVRSAGEIESYDVSKRANMTEKERQNKFPASMKPMDGIDVIQWYDHPYYKMMQEQKARNEAEKERRRQKDRERYQRRKQQELERKAQSKMDDAGVRFSVAEGAGNAANTETDENGKIRFKPQDMVGTKGKSLLEAYNEAGVSRLDRDKESIRDIKQKGEQLNTKFMAAQVDKLYPIKAYERFADEQIQDGKKEHFKGKSSPYVMSSNSIDAESRAKYLLTQELTDFDANPIGESLADIVGDLNYDDYKDFNTYLKLRHGLEWVATKRKDYKPVFGSNLLDNPETMKSVIKELEETHLDFADLAHRVYQYQSKLMQAWLVDTGVITQKQYDTLRKKYPDYVPFFRKDDTPTRWKGKSGIANQRNPIKEATGGMQPIYDPIENIMINTSRYVNASAKNSAMQAVVDIYDSIPGMEKYMAEVVKDENTKKYKLKNTDSENATDNISEGATEDIETTEYISDTVQHAIKLTDGDIVTVLQEGQKRYFKVFDKDLLRAIDNMTPIQSGIIMRSIASATRLFSALATNYNPTFTLVSNPIKDTQSAFIQTTRKNPFSVVTGFVGAAFEQWKNSEMGKKAVRKVTNNPDFDGTDTYKKYMAMGGEYASAFSAGRSAMKEALRAVKPDKGGAKEKVGKVVRFVPHAYGTTADTFETGHRLGEFEYSEKRGNDVHQAHFDSKNVTLNFGRSGYMGQQINKFVPFYNPSVQGIYKMVQSFKEKPFQTSARVAVTIIISALALGWNKRDEEKEEDYRNASAYLKNNYYLFSVGDGKFIKIPKAQGYGVVPSLFERAVEKYAYDNPDAFYNIDDYLSASLLPSILDNKFPFISADSVIGLGTKMSIAKNEDYKGSPIVPDNLADEVISEQYDERTTYIARWIGKQFNWSPKVVDYAIKSNTGFIGKINESIFHPGEKDWTLGVNTKFSADSLFSTDNVNMFYENKDEADRQATSFPTADSVYLSKRFEQSRQTLSSVYKICKEDTESDTGREMRRAYVNYAKEYKDNPMGLSDDVYNKIKDLYETDTAVLNMPKVERELEMKIDKEDKTFVFSDAESVINYQKDLNRGVDEAYRKLLSGVSFNAMTDAEKAEALKDARSDASKAVKKFYIENEGKKRMYAADGSTSITEPSKADIDQYRQKMEYQEEVTGYLQTIADNVAKAVPDKADNYSVTSMQINDIQSAKIDGKSYKISGDVEKKVIETANDVHYSNVEKLMNNEINVQDAVGYTPKGRARTFTQADGTKVQLTGKLYNADGTPRFDETAIAQIMKLTKEAAKDQAIEQYKDEITGSATPTFTPTPTSDTSSTKVSSNTTSSGERRRFTSAKASGGSSSKATAQTGNKVRFTGRANTTPTRRTQTASVHLPNVVTPKAVNTDIMQQAVNSFMKNAEIKPIQPLKNPLTM